MTASAPRPRGHEAQAFQGGMFDREMSTALDCTPELCPAIGVDQFQGSSIQGRFDRS
ncbi:hypothetical protein [Actinoplanes sp. NPDC051411]|uniref:hypothetical protein n=1 Tax=Actinoplanes sp. NPDC051411 TaxID=3155522 RepID=UPI00344AF0BA